MSNTTKEFICPCLSLKKEIIDNNTDDIYENVFLHILPYLVADKKNLKEYHGLVSYDIQYTLLPEDKPSMQIKFISSAIQNKKNLKRVNQEYKDTYSIFYTEYKYYKKNIYKNMAYNVSYADLDEYIKKHYTQIMIVYFIVQNLIRLANHDKPASPDKPASHDELSNHDERANQNKLYSLANAKILSYITDDDNDENILYAQSAITRAWNDHKDSALIIFGFVQNLLDELGWSDIFKIEKFLSNKQYLEIKKHLNSTELRQAFIKKIDNETDDNNTHQILVTNILNYALSAGNILGKNKHCQAKSHFDLVHLSKNTIQKLSLTEKKIDFKKLTQEEILSLEN